MFTLRAYKPRDISAMAHLFYDTVHSVNKRDYTPQQLRVWATGHVDCAAWEQRFSSSLTIIAEREVELLGFGNRVAGGEIDCLYVHRDYQRQGVGSAILRALEAERGDEALHSYASLTAGLFLKLWVMPSCGRTSYGATVWS